MLGGKAPVYNHIAPKANTAYEIMAGVGYRSHVEPESKGNNGTN